MQAWRVTYQIIQRQKVCLVKNDFIRIKDCCSEDEIFEDVQNMEKVKLAEIRIQELKALQENLQKEINRMKEEIAVFNCKLNLFATDRVSNRIFIQMIRLHKLR